MTATNKTKLSFLDKTITVLKAAKKMIKENKTSSNTEDHQLDELLNCLHAEGWVRRREMLLEQSSFQFELGFQGDQMQK